jgi:hypothetical protein
MTAYNPKNERIKREYFRYQKEAGRKADSTIEGIRKAIGRFEEYIGRKDFATFNKEQAIGFKKHLARSRGARTGEPMAKPWWQPPAFSRSSSGGSTGKPGTSQG